MKALNRQVNDNAVTIGWRSSRYRVPSITKRRCVVACTRRSYRTPRGIGIAWAGKVFASALGRWSIVAVCISVAGIDLKTTGECLGDLANQLKVVFFQGVTGSQPSCGRNAGH